MPSKTIKLIGSIPAKKSLYRRRKGGGLYLDKSVKQEIDALIIQCLMQWGRDPVQHPDIVVSFQFRNAARDSDGAWVLICDLLQKSGVTYNDNVRHFNGTITILPAYIDPKAEEQVVLDIRWME